MPEGYPNIFDKDEFNKSDSIVEGNSAAIGIANSILEMGVNTVTIYFFSKSNEPKRYIGKIEDGVTLAKKIDLESILESKSHKVNEYILIKDLFTDIIFIDKSGQRWNNSVGDRVNRLEAFANKYNLINYHTSSNVCFIGKENIFTMTNTEVLKLNFEGEDIRVIPFSCKYFDYSTPMNATFKRCTNKPLKKVKETNEQYPLNNSTLTIVGYNSMMRGLRKLELYIWFYNLVKTGSIWDIKLPEQWEETVITPAPGSYGTNIIINDNIRTPEQLGNLLYGYTGSALGFSLIELHGGSSVAAELPELKL